MALPTDATERKNTPIYSGVLKYFPDAIAYVAKVSKAGNDQHNPGQPLHWSRGKSQDHHDCISRHLIEAGTTDPVDGLRHSGKLAWRALAALQIELEAEGTKTTQATEQFPPKFGIDLCGCKCPSVYVQDGKRQCSICLLPLLEQLCNLTNSEGGGDR